MIAAGGFVVEVAVEAVELAAEVVEPVVRRLVVVPSSAEQLVAGISQGRS